ncbi:MAG TPA: FAD-dependent oxidoreductase [Gemmatimonadaceae bacterium]|nr:FAD-dependent oxidoreductase [Gemmatimonadaceae bacterium]
MTRSVSTLVIGGGVIGASVAWHLQQRGMRDVLVVDASPGPGHGSTGRATGGYRGQFANTINVQLSLLSRAKLRRFAEDTGVDPGYRAVGYLFLLDDAPALDAFREARAIQHAAGLTEAVELTLDEAQRINPQVEMDGVRGAAWCPTDATIRPLQILGGYLDAAQRGGVRVQWNTPVQGMERGADGRIRHVTANGERLAVDTVVNAAGAWSAPIAAMAGVPLPVKPTRRQIAVTEPLTTLDDGFPMTIWARDAFHLRVRDGRALLNWPVDTPRDDPYALDVDQPLVDAVWKLAQERVPAMRTSALDPQAHWVGLYEMSPDKTVILGRAPGCDNMVLVNGSSGHGVMHSPILGQLVSEIICDGAAQALDVHPLRPARFAEGDALPLSGML